MKAETVAALNEINRRFYHHRASEFSATRERPWAGWSELFELLSLPDDPRVLDLGCGNGRFARFLLERLEKSFSYLGIDQSPLALEEASRRLGGRERFLFAAHDFVSSEEPLPPELARRSFDLITLFGVMHHIPGRRRRRKLLESLSRNLASRGFLAYAIWRFADHERFRRKLVPWSELEKQIELPIDLSDLEPGDYLMTWGGGASGGRPALRYCHALSDEEEKELVSASSLSLAAKLDPSSEPNRYYLLRKD